MIKNSEELVQAGKDMIDALTKSGAALADGCGEIGQHIIALTHKSVTSHLATGKDVLDLRTPNDWADFHAKWAGDLVNTSVAHMSHLSKLSAKTINQTCEPLKTHFGAAFGRMGGRADD